MGAATTITCNIVATHVHALAGDTPLLARILHVEHPGEPDAGTVGWLIAHRLQGGSLLDAYATFQSLDDTFERPSFSQKPGGTDPD